MVPLFALAVPQPERGAANFIKGLRGRGVVAIRHKNMFYSFDEEKKEGEGETKE